MLASCSSCLAFSFSSSSSSICCNCWLLCCTLTSHCWEKKLISDSPTLETVFSFYESPTLICSSCLSFYWTFLAPTAGVCLGFPNPPNLFGHAQCCLIWIIGLCQTAVSYKSLVCALRIVMFSLLQRFLCAAQQLAKDNVTMLLGFIMTP